MFLRIRQFCAVHKYAGSMYDIYTCLDQHTQGTCPRKFKPVACALPGLKVELQPAVTIGVGVTWRPVGVGPTTADSCDCLIDNQSITNLQITEITEFASTNHASHKQNKSMEHANQRLATRG